MVVFIVSAAAAGEAWRRLDGWCRRQKVAAGRGGGAGCIVRVSDMSTGAKPLLSKPNVKLQTTVNFP